MNMHAAPATIPAASPRPRDDRDLIALCKRAKRLLDQDIEAEERAWRADVAFEASEPARPLVPDGCGTTERPSKEMRAHLRAAVPCNGKAVLADYRARIAKVAAYERECLRLDKQLGVTRLRKAASLASDKAVAAIADLSEVQALTLEGMANKAALLSLWEKAGYGLDNEGRDLAFSIAQDARILGTGGLRGGSPARTRN